LLSAAHAKIDVAALRTSDDGSPQSCYVINLIAIPEIARRFGKSLVSDPRHVLQHTQGHDVVVHVIGAEAHVLRMLLPVSCGEPNREHDEILCTTAEMQLL
jgi:hypothetical protein